MGMKVEPYDIGCQPSPSDSAETLIQDGWHSFLIFFAVANEEDETGHLKDLGVAVVECERCSAALLGYPNDEGRPEHPLYSFIYSADAVLEVRGSRWAQDIAKQRAGSAMRIWGERDMAAMVQGTYLQKHFIVLLKEQTFECIADGLKVALYAETFEQAFAYVHRRLGEQ